MGKVTTLYIQTGGKEGFTKEQIFDYLHGRKVVTNEIFNKIFDIFNKPRRSICKKK